MASTEISWNGRHGGGPVNQNLKVFDVGRSPIDDVGMVASLLSDIFPNLVKIWVWGDSESDVWVDDESDDEGENYDRWQEAIEQYMEKRVGSAPGTQLGH